MKVKLVLHNFTKKEQTSWKNAISIFNNTFYAFEYVYTRSEIEINHFVIQEKFDLVICYLQSGHTPKREFWRYLTGSLRTPVVLVKESEYGDDSEYFEYGIEDILELDKIELRKALEIILKIFRRSQVRRIEIQTLRLESEGIILREPSILIVEDDGDLLRALQVFLEKTGYKVYSGQSMAEGIMLFAQNRPDLVIADYYLPDGTAETFLSELGLSRQSYDVSFFIISGESAAPWRLQILYEIEDIITKPVNFQELEVRIRRSVQRNLYHKKLQNKLTELETQKKIAEKYISSEITQSLEDGIFPTDTRGHTQIATIAFFDLRDSTRLGDTIGPENFSEILNSILHDVMDLAVSNNGTINKMLGDGLLIVFGAPDPRRGTPEDAVKFAFRTKEHFDNLNDLDVFNLGQKINFGVGIATGKVFAGHVGSIHRMEFTLMGDIVNTASRLESLNKKTRTNVLIDSQTFEFLPGNIKSKFNKYKVIIRGKGDLQIPVWGNR